MFRKLRFSFFRSRISTSPIFHFSVMHYSSSSGSALCRSAGGWEEEEDADEIWIISSQCRTKPHFAGAPAFQCSSPPTQPASCRPSIWLLSPTAQPLISQTHMHKCLYLPPPSPNETTTPLLHLHQQLLLLLPLPFGASCTTGNAAFWRRRNPVNRTFTQNSRQLGA